MARIEPKMYTNVCIKPGRKLDDTITMKRTRIGIDSVKLCTIGGGLSRMRDLILTALRFTFILNGH